MKDIYCPKCDCELTFVNQSLLYSEFYYCEKCDKIFELTVREITDKELVNLYNSKRGGEMKNSRANMMLNMKDGGGGYEKA